MIRYIDCPVCWCKRYVDEIGGRINSDMVCAGGIYYYKCEPDLFKCRMCDTEFHDYFDKLKGIVQESLRSMSSIERVRLRDMKTGRQEDVETT